MDQRIRYASAPGGEEIAYATVGEGPLLVLAAWWLSHLELDWQDPSLRSFFETLAQRHTVVRYDRPGVGMSSRGERAYDLVGETAYLNTVIDAALRDQRADRVDLFGISCGGPGSVRVAAERPGVVRSLVLFGSYVTGAEITDEATRHALTDLVRANWGMGSQTLTSVLLPGATSESVRRFNRAQRDTATADVAARLLELTFTLDADHDVSSVDVPTLVVHRSHDLVIPCALGRKLAASIPGAEYQELEGKVHVPWNGEAGSALEVIERFLTGGGSIEPPQRRLTTVCFLDIVESTRMLSELGDARWRERLDHVKRIILEEAGSRGGTFVKDTGDGAMLTFPMPGDACDFAIALRGRARRIDLPLRIGVHTGEVEVRGDDITGLSVVVASRIADLGAADQILATSTTAELAAGSAIRFEDFGTHDLKGVAGERRIVEVEPRHATSDSGSDDGRFDRADGSIRFGQHQLDHTAFELRRDGEVIDVEPQVFEILSYLAQRPGVLVTREELLDNVWGDRFVSEASVSSRIRSARAAVDDDGRRQAVIKTVHGRGFRFVAPIE